MLLQLPPELQQRVVECLPKKDALSLRRVNKHCRDLTSSSIDSVCLRSAGQVLRVSTVFPGLKSLCLKPETPEDTVLLSYALLPEQRFSFPNTLRQLTIDTSESTYDTLRCFQVAHAVRDCPDLMDIHLTGYIVDLTADDAFLRKVTGVIATIAVNDPQYPPACFLGGGISNPSRLSACTSLRAFKSYTRTDDQTSELASCLVGLASLRALELHVPCIEPVAEAFEQGTFPGLLSLKLVGRSHVAGTSFDMGPVSSIDFLVFSTPSYMHLRLNQVTSLPRLEKAWLHGVVDFGILEFAPRLTTLSLSYDIQQWVATHVSAVLPKIPNLERLELCDVEVSSRIITSCAKLREVVLVDVIDSTMYNPRLYIVDLTASLTLQTIWVSSEDMRYLFATDSFTFATFTSGCLRPLTLEGWTGKICRPENRRYWFDDPSSAGPQESRPYELGLQLTRS